jgi:hypothetical protein
MPWRYMGEWCYSSTILDLSTRWRWVVSSKPQHFSPGEISPPSTHWRGGWVDSRAGLDAREKRKIFPCQESRHSCPAHSPSLYWLLLYFYRCCILIPYCLWTGLDDISSRDGLSSITRIHYCISDHNRVKLIHHLKSWLSHMSVGITMQQSGFTAVTVKWTYRSNDVCTQ